MENGKGTLRGTLSVVLYQSLHGGENRAGHKDVLSGETQGVDREWRHRRPEDFIMQPMAGDCMKGEVRHEDT